MCVVWGLFGMLIGDCFLCCLRMFGVVCDLFVYCLGVVWVAFVLCLGIVWDLFRC